MIHYLKRALASRIAYVLVAAILGFLSQCAHAADVPASYRWVYKGVTYTDGATWCQFRINEKNSTQPPPTSYTYISTALSDSGPATGPRATCTFDVLYNGAIQYRASDEYMDSTYYCPSGDAPRYTATGYVCTPPPPPNCNEGEVLYSGDAFFPVKPQVGCKDNCEILWNPTGASFLDCEMSTGVGTCYYKQNGSYKKTGASCIGSTEPAAVTPPRGPCPVCDCLKQGKSYGTVNGAVVCVTAGTPGTPPVKTTTPPVTSSTSTSNTNGSTTTNNSSTTTSSTTINNSSNGSTATTTSTTTNSDGTTSTSTTTVPKGEFCAKNPANPACTGDPTGSDDGTGKGDCKKDPASCTGEDLPAAEDIQTREITASFTPLDMTGQGAGSCPAPLNVPIGPYNASISYDWICQYASMIKPFMLAFAFLSGAFIIFGAARQEN